ncbi:hypothetical protein M9H77_04334 [Catharanthus roseus]|uniref:Uncharacterized protein n=1 Tax=Catharanthus roseus TaxID=4058 RepID=A0ACC0CDT4_CATRO|nr:hypothetical protein M9H77_04334 [Catharanthus roseus]
MSRGFTLCVASPRTRVSSKRHVGNVILYLDLVDRERSTVKGLKNRTPTMCFGVQAGINYGIPEFVPMTSFKDSNSSNYILMCLPFICGLEKCFENAFLQAKFIELKNQAERVTVETGMPLSSDDALIFKVVGGINEDHVYGFCSDTRGITTESYGTSTSLMPYISFSVVHDRCCERDKRWMNSMQSAQDTFASYM